MIIFNKLHRSLFVGQNRVEISIFLKFLVRLWDFIFEFWRLNFVSLGLRSATDSTGNWHSERRGFLLSASVVRSCSILVTQNASTSFRGIIQLGFSTIR